MHFQNREKFVTFVFDRVFCLLISTSPQVNTFAQKAILFLVTGGGTGYFPWFPGTIGTLVAVPLSLGLNRMALTHFPFALFTLVGSILCAIWLSTKGAAILRQKDPKIIVIDEVVGFLVANFLAPPRMVALIWAFLLFRFFDITKLFPAAKLEELPGGGGIVLDDVMAGLYTLMSLRLLLRLGWA